MRIIICKNCGKQEPHCAKGLCKTCYYDLDKKNIIKCKSCGLMTPKGAKGLCRSCYDKQYLIKCVECDKISSHNGKGLCKTCYAKKYPRHRKIVCRICGKESINKAYGRCEKCYDRYRKHTSARKVWQENYIKKRRGILTEQRLKKRIEKIKFLGERCKDCGNIDLRVLQIHHKIERINGGTDNKENLEVLCANCHMIKTLEFWKRYWQKKEHKKVDFILK